MRSLTRLFAISVLLFSVISNIITTARDNNTRDRARNGIVYLNGEIHHNNNRSAIEKNVHGIDHPVIRMLNSKSKTYRGTVLLLPDGINDISENKKNLQKITKFLNREGYDVALFEYYNTRGPDSRDSLFPDALKAVKLFRSKSKSDNQGGNHLTIIGLKTGGNLAARVVQRSGVDEQPDNLILIDPLYMDETNPGTVFPAIMPPLQPSARLLCIISDTSDKKLVNRCVEYSKTWTGYDGCATFHLLSGAYKSEKDKSSSGIEQKLEDLIRIFLREQKKIVTESINPAAVETAGDNTQRHKEKLELTAKDKYNLIFIGNSITHSFEDPDYQPVWNQFYAPRKALNLGYSGYRTENILWNIKNGELDGQKPRVIVLEIGTNNIDEKNYPTRHTAGQLAGGIEAIVRLLQEKLPETKIIILRCFPGSYDGPNPTSHRAILERASDIVSKLADGKNVFYCDVNHLFLNLDGSINHEKMPDWLHPSPSAAMEWAQVMEPLISELMGDVSRDIETPAN